MDSAGQPAIEHAIATFLVSRVPRDLAATLRADTPLLASGAVDSISVVELMIHLDELYAIDLSDEDFDERNFATIGTLAAFVESKRATH